MKKTTMITSIVLSGSLALLAGPVLAQMSPRNNHPAGSLPEATQPGSSGSAVESAPGQNNMGQEQGGMNLSSEQIKEIQQALKEKGHDPGSVNGSMDQQTREAIREFQKDNNLTVTGTVDQETANKLGVSIGSDVNGGIGTSPGSNSGTYPYGSGSSGPGSGSSGSGLNK